MSGFLKFLGGTLFVVAIFAGWWAIDRAQEHLPGPINAVIDSVQNGGMPGAGPIVRPLELAAAGTSVEACPEFADDVRTLEATMRSSVTVSQDRADANNAVIEREVKRIADGGATRPLEESGVADALTEQAATLDSVADAVDGARFRTPQADSLATGLTAAARRVAEAHREFVAKGTGTRAQWQAWLESVGGPVAQVEAASRGFSKCPA